MKPLASNVYTMYHLGMKTNIMQWGNSLAVRIPKSFAKEIKIDTGMEIDIHIKNGAIIIAKPEYNLTELLNQITPKNIHGGVDWGPPVGKEIW